MTQKGRGKQRKSREKVGEKGVTDCVEKQYLPTFKGEREDRPPILSLELSIG